MGVTIPLWPPSQKIEKFKPRVLTRRPYGWRLVQAVSRQLPVFCQPKGILFRRPGLVYLLPEFNGVQH